MEGKRGCTLEYPVPESTFEPGTYRTFILMPACGGGRLHWSLIVPKWVTDDGELDTSHWLRDYLILGYCKETSVFTKVVPAKY